MRFARRWSRAKIAGRRHKVSLLLALLLAGNGAVGVRAAAAGEPGETAPPVYETVVPAPAPDVTAPREDGAASASVVTQRRTPRSGETMPQILSELPGVTVTRHGSYGSLATLSLRGSPPNQVMVYADGVPLNGALVGTVDIGLLPLTAAQRIEVYRGQSPLAFGTSAIGGVLSLTTEAPASSQGTLHSGVGSYGTRMVGGEAAYAGRRLRLVGRLGLFRTRADFPYVNDLGTTLDASDDQRVRRENNQLDQQDAAVRAELALPGRRELAVAAGAIAREQGLPPRGQLRAIAAQLTRRRLHGSASYQSRDDLGEGGRLRATLYTLASDQRFQDLQSEIAFRPTHTRDRSFTVGATGLASQPVGRALVLSWLGDARHEAFHPHTYIEDSQPGDGQRDSAALGMSASLWLERLALELILTARGELSHERRSAGHGLLAGAPDASGTDSHLLPVLRLGLSQAAHESLRLRANAGYYARLPTLFERYGNSGTIIGSPGLASERGLTADVGARWALSGSRARFGLLVDGALFATQSRDLIDLQQEGYFARFRNLGRTRGLGAELSVDARAGVAHLFLQTTLQDLRDRSADAAHRGRPVAGHPWLRGYLRPELRALPLPGRLSAGVYADAALMSGSYYDPASQNQRPARAMLGAGGYLAHAGAGLRAVVSAYNLGGDQTPEVTGFPLPGRSLFVTLHFAYPQEETDP
jgi:outer membrane receptor protein involved in Fe transport